MLKESSSASFIHVKDEQLRQIILDSLREMRALLEETTCLSATSLADQLNDIKKSSFEEMYKIGRETLDLDKSEEVLKAIRALQDAFGQIIVAISPMDSLSHCLNDIWIAELTEK